RSSSSEVAHPSSTTRPSGSSTATPDGRRPPQARSIPIKRMGWTLRDLAAVAAGAFGAGEGGFGAGEEVAPGVGGAVLGDAEGGGEGGAVGAEGGADGGGAAADPLGHVPGGRRAWCRAGSGGRPRPRVGPRCR